MAEVRERTAFTFDLYRNGLRGFRVNGKTVLDFGCGELRPLEICAVFWLNGASRCIAVDQKPATQFRVVCRKPRRPARRSPSQPA
jgi:hypothetical protein